MGVVDIGLSIDAVSARRWGKRILGYVSGIMQIEDLSSLHTDSTIEADLVIIGAGAAGLTIAHRLQ
jgi:ribulose 1,5-bisphosphate synthetase/thiazole synthase